MPLYLARPLAKIPKVNVKDNDHVTAIKGIHMFQCSAVHFF